MLSIGKGKRLLVWFLFDSARKTMVELNEERQEIGLRGEVRGVSLVTLYKNKRLIDVSHLALTCVDLGWVAKR